MYISHSPVDKQQSLMDSAPKSLTRRLAWVLALKLPQERGDLPTETSWNTYLLYLTVRMNHQVMRFMMLTYVNHQHPSANQQVDLSQTGHLCCISPSLTAPAEVANAMTRAFDKSSAAFISCEASRCHVGSLPNVAGSGSREPIGRTQQV